MNEQRFSLRLAYDGTDFVGWQIQKSGRTVQLVLESVLADMHGHDVRVVAAGRTDSGVHARGQVVHYDSDSNVPVESIPKALNSKLPRDVRIIDCRPVSDDFHARYSARMREYSYYIEPAEYSDPFSRRFALTLKSCPPIDLLNECATCLVGTRDFTSFSATGDQSKSKIRSIRSASFRFEGRFVVFQVAANAFLWKMVRSMVGTILEFCREPDPAARIDEALAACNRGAAGSTAPAKGLFLTRVHYDA